MLTIKDQMMEILRDGRPHTRQELFECCDPLADISVVRKHVCELRNTIPVGTAILCILINRSIGYQWVRLIAKDT